MLIYVVGELADLASAFSVTCLINAVTGQVNSDVLRKSTQFVRQRDTSVVSHMRKLRFSDSLTSALSVLPIYREADSRSSLSIASGFTISIWRTSKRAKLPPCAMSSRNEKISFRSCSFPGDRRELNKWGRKKLTKIT